MSYISFRLRTGPLYLAAFFKKGMDMKIVGFLSLAITLALFWVAASHEAEVILPTTLTVGGVWCIYHQATRTRDVESVIHR
jgi:hypothetical protein